MALNNGLKIATLADLEAILDEYGDRPQIVYGVAVAARRVWQSGPRGRISRLEKVRFLLGLLNDVFYGLDQRRFAIRSVRAEFYGPVWDELYPELVGQLLEMEAELFAMVDGNGCPLGGLVSFLGKHPPLEGMRGKVREFLKAVVDRCLTARYANGEHCPPAIVFLSNGGWHDIVKALLRYQMFTELKILVIRGVYEAIPIFFKAVVGQVGPGNVGWFERRIEEIVRSGGEASEAITAALLMIDDARALRFLVELSRRYIDDHEGDSFPIDKLYDR